MSLYFNTNSQMIYNFLDKTLGEFKGHYKCKEIEDAVSELFTNTLEGSIRPSDRGREDIADILNRLCSYLVWIRNYAISNKICDKRQMDEAIQIALFNFDLGKPPQHSVIFPVQTKQFLEKAQHTDPSEDLPYLPNTSGKQK